MKKTAFILGLLWSVFINISVTAQSTGYVIDVDIEGADGISFTLQERANGRIVNLDSAVVVNGKFRIAGKTMVPSMVSLVARSSKKGFTFFVENSKISILAKFDSLSNAKISGSKTQDEFYTLLNTIKANQEKIQVHLKNYQSASQSGDTLKMNEIRTLASNLSIEIMKIQKDFVKQNPKSYVSPVIISSLANMIPQEEVESLISQLDPAISKIPAMTELKARYISVKSVDIGQKAPNFTLNDPNGVPVSLSSRTGKNLLLVDFWAAWCGPCRRENPAVVKVYNEFKQKGFDVLGVSLDRNKEDWVKAISDDNLTWTHVSDLAYFNNAAARLYFVNSIPSNVLLDKNGIIVAKNLRGEDLYNKVKQLLQEVRP
jgi:peroxiredoxin